MSSPVVGIALQHIEAQGMVRTPESIKAMEALFVVPTDNRGLERLLILSSELVHRACILANGTSPQTIIFGGIALATLVDCARELAERLGAQL